MSTAEFAQTGCRRRDPPRSANAAGRDSPPAGARRLRVRLRRLDPALRDLGPARAGDRLDRRRPRLCLDRPLAAGDRPAAHRLAADGDLPARLRLHPRPGRLDRDLPPLHDDDRLRPLRLLRPDADRVAAGADHRPGAVHWWDVCFSFLYTSHFIVPFALAGVLWARSRTAFKQFRDRFLTLSGARARHLRPLPGRAAVDGLRARPARADHPQLRARLRGDQRANGRGLRQGPVDRQPGRRRPLASRRDLDAGLALPLAAGELVVAAARRRSTRWRWR